MHLRSKLLVWSLLISLDVAYLGLVFESKGMTRSGIGLFLIVSVSLVGMGIRKLGVTPRSVFKGTVRSAKNTAILGRQHLKLSKRLILISTIALITGTLILSTVIVFPPRAVPSEMERRYHLAPIVSDLSASMDILVSPEINVPSPQEVSSEVFSLITKNINQLGSIKQDYLAVIRETEFNVNVTALYRTLFKNESNPIGDFLVSRTSMVTIDAPGESIRTIFPGFNLSEFLPNEIGLAIIMPKRAFFRDAINELTDALLDLPPHSELAIPITSQSGEFGEKDTTGWLNVSIAKVIKAHIDPLEFVERGFMFPSNPNEIVLLNDIVSFGDLTFIIYIPWSNTPALESVFEKPILSENQSFLFRYFYNARFDTPADLLERNEYDLKFLQSLQRAMLSEDQESNSPRYYPNITSPYLEYVPAEEATFLKIDLWIEALLLGIPLLILSFYLVDFANNLLSKRKRRIIRLLRIRGGSELHVLIVLLLELLVAGVISGIFALALVVPLIESSLNVNALFRFSLSPNLWNYPRYASSLQLIFLGSILLNLHLNSNTLARFIQATITDLEEPWENAQSLVQKLNLDIIAAAAGVISGVILYFRLFLRVPGIFSFFLAIIIILGFYGLTFGTVSLLFRWFPKIIVVLSLVIGNAFDHLVLLSLRNLNLRKITAARVVSLLIIGLIIANFFAILGSSIDRTYYNQSLYLRGGEVSIQFYDNMVPQEFLTEFARIKGLEAWTNVTLLVFTGTGFVYSEQRFLLINSTSFFSVRNIPENNLVSLQEKSVKEALRTPNGIIISDYEHKEFGYDLGDNLSLSFWFSPDHYPPWINQSLPFAKYSQTFTIRGIYKYWPIAGSAAHTITSDVTHYAQYNARIADVGTFPDLAYFAQQALNHNPISPEMEVSAYSYVIGNLADGADPNAVLEEINGLLAKYQLTFAEPFVLYSDGDSATTPLVWAMLSLNIIASFMVAGLAIVLFSFITWSDRKQEAGLLKSLGMTRGQLSAMFVLENLVLLIFGALTGLLISLFLAFSYLPRFISLFISSFDPADTHLPLTIAIPWELLLLGVFSIVATGIVASVIVASMFSKQPAADILRVE